MKKIILIHAFVCVSSAFGAGPASEPPPGPGAPWPRTTDRDVPISRLKASTATSERTSYNAASKAIDGDPAVGWVSELGALKTKGPQSITVELDETIPIDALRYFFASTAQSDPKRAYVNWLARIQKYEVSVGTDGKSFQSVASGAWDKTALGEQRVSFPAVPARFVRLTAISADRDGAAVGELSLESPNPPQPAGLVLKPPADAARRRAKFADRDSAGQLQELAARLARMTQRSNPEFAAFFAAQEKGEGASAIAAFNRAVIERAKRFAFLFDFEENPEPLGISQAMLANVVGSTQIKATFDVGEPGAIPWEAPEIRAELKRRQLRAFGSKTFAPLLASYRASGQERYLSKWAEFVDDMLINDRSYREMTPFNMLDHDSTGPRRVQHLLADLLKTEQERPGTMERLPVGLLARIFTEMLPDHVALAAAYYHANAQNWTHGNASSLIKAAAFFDGLLAMDTPLAERALRMMETYEVRSNLPDGTEAEQALWYNWGWVDSVLNFLRAVDEVNEVEPGCLTLDPARRAELEEAALRRARFSMQIYTPAGEWPLFLRGDDRKLFGVDFMGAEENLLKDPAVAAMRRVLGIGREPGTPPSFTSNYFPWGGYRIVRENWNPKSQYGSMFVSPKPGKYWARGGPDHLNFGLHAFGQDLLIDNARGHYSGFSSPVTVDGREQELRIGYPLWGHKQLLLNGWETPDNARFLSSPAVEFMEGTYAGPYGAHRNGKPEEIAAENQAASRGVTHQRQVVFLREVGLWIVADWLKADQPRAFSWRWLLPAAPAGVKFFAFEPAQITLDAAVNTIRTMKPGAPNLTMRTFTSTPLQFARSDRSKAASEQYGPKDNPWNSLCEVRAGLLLGGTQLSIDDKASTLPAADFAFSLESGGQWAIHPVPRPIELVQIGPARNVFVGEESVELSCPTQGVEIRYTVDGSDPTRESALSSGPLKVRETTTLKARAFRPGIRGAADLLDFTAASPVSLARFVREEPREAVVAADVQPGIKATLYEGDWQKLFVSTALGDPAASAIVPSLMDISCARGLGRSPWCMKG